MNARRAGKQRQRYGRSEHRKRQPERRRTTQEAAFITQANEKTGAGG
jgi:uncharacterized protein (DUF924 family)